MRFQRSALFVFSFFIITGTAIAISTHTPQAYQQLWRTWALVPFIIIGLSLTLFLYLLGVYRLFKYIPEFRKSLFYFLAGWSALAFALISPLHSWGKILFSAHMAQHEILMLVAAPLMVLSRPLAPLLYALPLGWAARLNRTAHRGLLKRIWDFAVIPFVAALLFAITLWTWHIPFLFEAAIQSEFIHAIQHLTFFLTASLFWWAIIHGRERMTGYGFAAALMIATAIHCSLLGALLTFADSPWYPSHAHASPGWGLTPVRDQNLAGLVLWIPAGLIYTLASLALLAAWVRQSERRVAGWERKTHGALWR